MTQYLIQAFLLGKNLLDTQFKGKKDGTQEKVSCTFLKFVKKLRTLAP
jgi:hypothetical protein